MARLVPYGEPWRLGANEATAIHVPFPARIAGMAVEPGWYALYPVPRREGWTIVVNREARRWGIPIDEEGRKQDVGSDVVRARKLQETVEKTTMEFWSDSSRRAHLYIRWEQVEVRVPVGVARGRDQDR